MTAIHVIFNGKHFVPNEPVLLPADSKAVVWVTPDDPAARAKLDAEIRAYYQSAPDRDDEAWAKTTARESSSAWDEE